MNDLCGPALGDGHLRGIEDQLRAQVRRHGPADHTPAPSVDDHGGVQKPRPGRHVGNVGHPELIRPGSREGALHEIRRRPGRGVSAGRARPRPPADADEPGNAHEAGDPLARDPRAPHPGARRGSVGPRRCRANGRGWPGCKRAGGQRSRPATRPSGRGRRSSRSGTAQGPNTARRSGTRPGARSRTGPLRRRRDGLLREPARGSSEDLALFPQLPILAPSAGAATRLNPRRRACARERSFASSGPLEVTRTACGLAPPARPLRSACPFPPAWSDNRPRPSF